MEPGTEEVNISSYTSKVKSYYASIPSVPTLWRSVSAYFQFTLSLLLFIAFYKLLAMHTACHIQQSWKMGQNASKTSVKIDSSGLSQAHGNNKHSGKAESALRKCGHTCSRYLIPGISVVTKLLGSSRYGVKLRTGLSGRLASDLKRFLSRLRWGRSWSTSRTRETRLMLLISVGSAHL